MKSRGCERSTRRNSAERAAADGGRGALRERLAEAEAQRVGVDEKLARRGRIVRFEAAALTEAEREGHGGGWRSAGG